MILRATRGAFSPDFVMWGIGRGPLIASLRGYGRTFRKSGPTVDEWADV
jgi:hypothetical protein